jgi:hypothetical protein
MAIPICKFRGERNGKQHFVMWRYAHASNVLPLRQYKWKEEEGKCMQEYGEKSEV